MLSPEKPTTVCVGSKNRPTLVSPEVLDEQIKKLELELKGAIPYRVLAGKPYDICRLPWDLRSSHELEELIAKPQAEKSEDQASNKVEQQRCRVE